MVDAKWYHDSARGIIVAVRLARSKLLDDAGFRHAFPLRGASDAELLDALGVDRIAGLKQVHGARAVVAGEASRTGEVEEADAVVGRGAGVAVGVRVADCVPLLVGDRASGDVAAIHAGWRGIVAGVVRAGVELLGGRDLVASIGPCIGSCCFEVGGDVAERIGFTVREEGGKAWVDLRAAVRAQLRELGVSDARIEDVEGCTKCDAARFHSFRRDGANSGRMLAAIAGREAGPRGL